MNIKLKTNKEIRNAFKDISKNARKYNPEADIRGMLVSPMADQGVEIIIGTKYDDQFGPVIMYGLGGIMVEILKDVSFRVLPITRSAAKKMIEQTNAQALGGESERQLCRHRALADATLSRQHQHLAPHIL